MKKIHMIRKLMLLFIVLVFMGYACIEQKDGYLVKVYDEAHDQIGVNTAYVNQAGDTVIPFGKYYYCFTDTFRDFAMMIDHEKGCVGIDRDENILYKIHWYDNGPDYIVNGLFRIIKDGKFGFANRKGEIIIEPKYECAFPF